MVCVGEGEGAILDLCRCLLTGGDPSLIRNLWVKQRDGSVVKNSLRPAVKMDDLPAPDYTLFDDRDERFYFPMNGKLLRIGSVETHRGCPYTCTFCNSPGQNSLYRRESAGPFFRLKSPGRVRAELKSILDQYRVEYIRFPADTFLAMPDDSLEDFARMYSEFRVPFWCQTRPETLTKRRVEILNQMGCADLSVGIEHGNEEFRRKVVHRNYSNDLLVDCFELLRKADFRVRANNIVGLPTETRALTWDTIRLNRRIQHVLVSANAHHFTPYRGTELRKLAILRGYINETTQVVHNTKDTVLNMPEFTRDEINGAVRTFMMYVRFPESKFSRIGLAERFDERGNKEFALLREEFVDRYFDPSRIEIHDTPSVPA
jgi:radical SAM superfamily enzyme YgiQ (UPF0313 family)